jgi:chromosome segregation ATPase
MEMDTPEQQTNKPAKHTRVRLASPRKELERTIQKMKKLSETAENTMKPEKLVDLLTTMAGLQVKLLDMDMEAKLHDLVDENEQVKSELAAAKTQRDDAIQRMLEQINGERRKNEAELKTLNSQIATLQAQNAELMTTNNTLKSKNSELTEEVPRLILENAELELKIKTLESRSPQELMDEVNAKLKALTTL